MPPTVYHEFWGWRHDVLVGEVELVNDDDTDNRVFDPFGRFVTIEEDEVPMFLLQNDYERYWDGGGRRQDHLRRLALTKVFPAAAHTYERFGAVRS